MTTTRETATAEYYYVTWAKSLWRLVEPLVCRNPVLKERRKLRLNITPKTESPNLDVDWSLLYRYVVGRVPSIGVNTTHNTTNNNRNNNQPQHSIYIVLYLISSHRKACQGMFFAKG
jgi:hypothetical protein